MKGEENFERIRILFKFCSIRLIIYFLWIYYRFLKDFLGILIRLKKIYLYIHSAIINLNSLNLFIKNINYKSNLLFNMDLFIICMCWWIFYNFSCYIYWFIWRYKRKLNIWLFIIFLLFFKFFLVSHFKSN